MREDILKTKLEKLENLKKSGMEVYSEKSERTMTNKEALDNFSAEGGDNISNEIYLVGRLKSFRPM